jgi:hypothetical protein
VIFLPAFPGRYCGISYVDWRASQQQGSSQHGKTNKTDHNSSSTFNFHIHTETFAIAFAIDYWLDQVRA